MRSLDIVERFKRGKKRDGIERSYDLGCIIRRKGVEESLKRHISVKSKLLTVQIIVQGVQFLKKKPSP